MFNFIDNSAFNDENKLRLKMELAKIAAVFTGCINVFLFIAAWFANFGNVKSTILFIVALCMSMYRFYRWSIYSKQKKKLRDLEIEKKKLENDEHIARVRILQKKIV